MHWVTVGATYMKASPWTSDPKPPLHSTTCGSMASNRRAAIWEDQESEAKKNKAQNIIGLSEVSLYYLFY